MGETNVLRRGAIYTFRIRTPADLTAIIKRREFWRSLRTACPAEAGRRASVAKCQAHQLFEAVRRNPTMTEGEIRILVRGFYQRELEIDKRERLTTLEPSSARFWGDTRKRLLAELRDHLARGEFSLVRWATDETVGRLGLGLAPDDRAYRELSQSLLRAWIEATQRAVERDRGDFSGEPRDPLLQSVPTDRSEIERDAGSVQNGSDQGKSVADLVERLLEEKRGLRPTTIGKYRAAAKLFDQFLCGQGVSQITRQQVVEFKNMLVRLPVNWSKRFHGMTPQEAIEANRVQKLPTLAPRNINDSYLTYINSTLKWAVDNNILRENPAANVSVAMPKGFSKRQQREPFTPEQLRSLFTSPLYSGCHSPGRPYKPGDHLIRDHRYWVPLVALWSGARLNELGQLEVGDVQQVSGIWCLRITTQVDGDGEEEEIEKVLKTTASKRLVPLHPELLQLGFLKYVTERQQSGGRRVFPLWRKANDGTYSSLFSKFFNNQLLKKLGIKNRKLCFHSLRHTFVDAMRLAGIEEGVQKALIGHSDPSTTALYGDGQPLVRLEREIVKVRYELSLVHLHPVEEISGLAA